MNSSENPRLIEVLQEALKIATSTAIRAAAFPEVLRKLRGGAFWSPSYFASSCGGAPLDVIKQSTSKGKANARKHHTLRPRHARPGRGNCAVSRGFAPGFSA